MIKHHLEDLKEGIVENYDEILIELINEAMSVFRTSLIYPYLPHNIALPLGPPDDVLSKIADLSHYFKCQEKI